MKRSYGPFLVEALLWGGSFMVAVFLAIFGAWKLLGVAPASLMIWGFQVGFSGSVYMIVIPLTRCAVKGMKIETYHFACLVIGAAAAYFTYHQLVQAEEFRLELLSFLLVAPPVGMLVKMWKDKIAKETQPQTQTV